MPWQERNFDGIFQCVLWAACIKNMSTVFYLLKIFFVFDFVTVWSCVPGEKVNDSVEIKELYLQNLGQFFAVLELQWSFENTVVGASHLLGFLLQCSLKMQTFQAGLILWHRKHLNIYKAISIVKIIHKKYTYTLHIIIVSGATKNFKMINILLKQNNHYLFIKLFHYTIYSSCTCRTNWSGSLSLLGSSLYCSYCLTSSSSGAYRSSCLIWGDSKRSLDIVISTCRNSPGDSFRWAIKIAIKTREVS